jgi:hypothetical protein
MFRDARLKIDRANKHIADVQATVGSLKDRYTSIVETHQPTGGQSLKYECPDLENILIELSLITGDAVHNLRASLDYAWIAIITKLGLPTTKWTRFPFYETRERLDEALLQRKINTASLALYERVLSDVKPYPGGNDTLWALNEIDILDKHKLLVPVINRTAVQGICVEDENGPHPGFTTWEKPGPAHVDFFPGVQIQNKGKISVSIVFDKGMPLARLPIDKVLFMLRGATLGTLEHFLQVFQ